MVEINYLNVRNSEWNSSDIDQWKHPKETETRQKKMDDWLNSRTDEKETVNIAKECHNV